MKSTAIKCNCGHRVIQKDVLQTGYYLSLFGPSFIYVRFRCARCKRVAEQLIPEDKWDPNVLNQPHCELTEEERQRFEQMGEISPGEMIDFHFGLEDFRALPEEVSAEE